MTDEELINSGTEWLKNNSEKPKDNYDYTISLNDAKNAIQWALAHQWINLKDKLPNDNDNVFIHHVDKSIQIAIYCRKLFYNFEGSNSRVDFWMPIPEIPKP